MDRKSLLYTISLLCILMLVVMICWNIYNRKGDKEENGGMRIKEHRSGKYVVYEIYGILTDEECIKLINTAKEKGLSDSTVWNYVNKDGNSLDKAHRTSKQSWINDNESVIASKISRLSEALTGISMSNQESLQVARYEQGGKFNAHYDSCTDDDKEFCAKMNNNAGERRSTLLIYLNDDFEGGFTEFVDIGISIKPERGKGILFYSTTTDDILIKESRHSGGKVEKGEKWIATKWSHSKEYKI